METTLTQSPMARLEMRCIFSSDTHDFCGRPIVTGQSKRRDGSDARGLDRDDVRQRRPWPAMVERAQRLNPRDPRGWLMSGVMALARSSTKATPRP
jgi:hypothetical protein